MYSGAYVQDDTHMNQKYTSRGNERGVQSRKWTWSLGSHIETIKMTETAMTGEPMRRSRWRKRRIPPLEASRNQLAGRGESSCQHQGFTNRLTFGPQGLT